MSLLLEVARQSKPVPEEELAAMPALVDLAFEALASGVSMTLREWANLAPIERKAFAEAGRRLELLNAQAWAVASSGSVAMGAMVADLDDGAAYEKALVDQVAEDLRGPA